MIATEIKASCFLAIVLALGFPGILNAQDQLVLIVHEHEPVDSLSLAQVRTMYLGTTGLWHGVRVRPAYVKPEEEGESARFETVVGMTYRRFRRYWLQKTFSGSGVAPSGFRSPQAVIEFVGSTPGALGFIPASAAGDLEHCKVVPLT